jgi:4-hydroxy-3-methylbut-2-en-1-yl diphosphate reductase
MIVDIDQKSGFCFGVVRAIAAAELELEKDKPLYCLGDIVHNSVEVSRLSSMGLKVIDHTAFKALRDCKVLIRAHGEPPETYTIAQQNNITLVDASCPIVLNLQSRIRKGFEETAGQDGEIIIFGKEGHAEVIGLKGQAQGRVRVIQQMDDLDGVDFSRPIRFFAQTTQDPATFAMLRDEIIRRKTDVDGTSPEEIDFKAFDSICRQVSNRAPELRKFAQSYDVVIFASDHKSSNGKYLYQVCKAENPNTYFISTPDELTPSMVAGNQRIGICGATSTPGWVMEEIRSRILAF